MAGDDLEAYCVYRIFEPEPPKSHRFDRHYLLYSAKGAMRLEAEDRVWTLPPSRAAWIPADTPIVVGIARPVTCCSVLFHRRFIDAPVSACKVFPVTPVAREMIQHTRRWGPDSGPLDPYALSFFKALAFACTELGSHPSNTWIPKGKSGAVVRALDVTQSRLGEKLGFAEVADAARLSERSLARRFSEETGMTWREVQRRMRMIRALELLSNGGEPVLSVALAVGYESLSAFNRAFQDFAGCTPTAFRKLYA